jgi:hypothetical protein
MRSSRHSTLPSSRNAFRRSFLRRIAEHDEPPTAGEPAGAILEERFPAEA